jgi:2-polyprenyl-3-methyl-5-hydroxy-6-metoxy-1,4-benzoquinol methylase
MPIKTGLAASYKDQYIEIASADLSSSIQPLGELTKKAQKDFSRLGDLNGLRILEIGPGLGHLALLMQEKGGGHVDVLDLVPNYMLSLPRVFKGDKIEADIQDLSSVSIPDETYDLVVMCDVLEHVLRPADALLTVLSLLKPGGRLYLRSPSFEPLVQYSQSLGCPWEAVHLRTYTPYLLGLEVKSCGFLISKRPNGSGAPFRQMNYLAASHDWWEQHRRELSIAYDVSNPSTRLEAASKRAAGVRKRIVAVVRAARDRVAMGLFSRPGEVWLIARRPI